MTMCQRFPRPPHLRGDKSRSPISAARACFPSRVLAVAVTPRRCSRSEQNFVRSTWNNRHTIITAVCTTIVNTHRRVHGWTCPRTHTSRSVCMHCTKIVNTQEGERIDYVPTHTYLSTSASGLRACSLLLLLSVFFLRRFFFCERGMRCSLRKRNADETSAHYPLCTISRGAPLCISTGARTCTCACAHTNPPLL